MNSCNEGCFCFPQSNPCLPRRGGPSAALTQPMWCEGAADWPCSVGISSASQRHWLSTLSQPPPLEPRIGLQSRWECGPFLQEFASLYLRPGQRNADLSSYRHTPSSVCKEETHLQVNIRGMLIRGKPRVRGKKTTKRQEYIWFKNGFKNARLYFSVQNWSIMAVDVLLKRHKCHSIIGAFLFYYFLNFYYQYHL